MRNHPFAPCAFVAVCLLRLGLSAQSLPTSVVDAQIPIISTDGFSSPNGIAVAPGRTIYVADQGHSRVLQFSPTGVQTEVDFGALSPAIRTPGGIALDGSGNLYVTDETTNRLIKLAPGGTKGLPILTSPTLNQPVAVAADSAGNLAIVNAGNGTVVVRRSAGTPALLNTGTTVLIAPKAVAFDNQGSLYVADQGNGTKDPAIYRFPKLGGTGVNLTPAGYPLRDIKGLGVDDQLNLYVLDSASQQLIEAPANGAPAFLIPQSNFEVPSGLALDNLGNLYVSDSGAAPNSVTELVYNNAANFGSLKVGSTSQAVTFNFEFYRSTTIQSTSGIGGGDVNSEYKKAPGGTCALRTYAPSVSSTGLLLPASCTANLSFTPIYPGGRSGAIQLRTSNGNINQLTFGTGLGGQLSLLNAAVSHQLGSTFVGGIALNDAGTSIYYGGGGIYRMYAAGGTPTLVTPKGGISFAVNGAGDLFLFNPPTITKIAADGSPDVTINVPGLKNPQAMVMDTNGAFYISDIGLDPEDNPAGFVVRVSPTGVALKIPSTPGFWRTPGLMATDRQGDIYVADPDGRQVFVIPASTGNFSQITSTSLTLGGAEGTAPVNLSVDTSGTLYFWDTFLNSNFEGMAYTPPGAQAGPWLSNFSAGESELPLYTYPIIVGGDIARLFPFYSAFGNQTIAVSPNNKLYVVNGQGPGFFVTDRSQGNIPSQAFNPNTPEIGASTQSFFVYNTGNENLTFTDSTKPFTESGSGVGSFTFTFPQATSFGVVPCRPGTVVVPGNYCAINVTNANGTKGTIVTDSLHFLTDAVNNDTATFKISGVANPVP